MNAKVTNYDLLFTPRESQIAALVVAGATNKEIAQQLFISNKTVKNTLTKIFDKSGVRSRTELAVMLVRAGWPGLILQS